MAGWFFVADFFVIIQTLCLKKRSEKTFKILAGALSFYWYFSFRRNGHCFWIATLKIPDAGSLNDLKIAQSTKIYDRTGKIILWDIHSDIQRTVVPLAEISRHIKNATIAIEDSSFTSIKALMCRGL